MREGLRNKKLHVFSIKAYEIYLNITHQYFFTSTVILGKNDLVLQILIYMLVLLNKRLLYIYFYYYYSFFFNLNRMCFSLYVSIIL